MVVVRKVDPPPIVITSPTETFDIFATVKNNVFAFQNDTGITLTSLTLDLFAGSWGLTGIAPPTCTSVDRGKGDDKSDWKDKKNHDDKTVCAGGIYSLEFGGIPKDAVVQGAGSFVTPEPATAVMLFSGLMGLAGLRKRRVS
jgi:hypothetical protein